MGLEDDRKLIEKEGGEVRAELERAKKALKDYYDELAQAQAAAGGDPGRRLIEHKRKLADLPWSDMAAWSARAALLEAEIKAWKERAELEALKREQLENDIQRAEDSILDWQKKKSDFETNARKYGQLPV